MTRSLGTDARGVSEETGVAALVLLTVVVTASVGVGVLFIDAGEDDQFDASFSFQYFSQRSGMLVTYEDGEDLRASDVVLSGPANNVTWATLRGLNGTATISPGDSAQLNPQNAYGGRLTGRQNVSVVYVDGENRTVLDTWVGDG